MLVSHHHWVPNLHCLDKVGRGLGLVVGEVVVVVMEVEVSCVGKLVVVLVEKVAKCLCHVAVVVA